MSNIHNTYTGNTSTTGTIAANGQYVRLSFEGRGSAAVQVLGTWSGTLEVQSSVDDGATFNTVYCAMVTETDPAIGGLPVLVNSLISNGTYKPVYVGGVTHYQIKATAWTSGTANIVISAVSAIAAWMFTKSGIVQDVYADSNNTVLDEVTQIAGGATWTGSGTSTLGIVGIQSNLYADKNCTLYVDQSMNGTNWDISDEYVYYHSLGGQSWTTQATAAYVRLRVTNNDSTSTTVFRLQLALCPIVEALPRTLSEKGNLKVSVNEIQDDDGHTVGVSPMHELRVSEHITLVGITFGDVFDTNFWTKTIQTGAADATTASSILTLSTGATADGNILVNSLRRARYVPSYPNYYRGQLLLPAITGANLRRWGAFDANNGYFFEWDGTNLAVVVRKTAVDTKVYTGSFNGILGSDYVIDIYCHTYEIQWTNSEVDFSINGNLLHHAVSPSSRLTDTNHLYIGLQNVNSGGNTADNLMRIRSSTINRIGKKETNPAWKNQAGAATAQVLKYGPGKLHHVTINGWTSPATILLYDAVTATNPIASISLTSGTQGALLPVTLEYGLDFYTGLTYTTTGANTNVTIIYE